MNSRSIWSVLRVKLTVAAVSLFVVSGFANDEIAKFRQWQNIGPSGGDVRAVEVDPKNKNHLFLTTLDGQIYGSYDAGTTWELLANLHEPQLVLDDLIIDPRDSNILYVAGHRGKRPGGFFKSVDGGKTWKSAKELKGESIHAMVQASKDPNMLLVGSVSGVWISRDSGDTWTKFSSNTTPEKLDALAIDPRDTNIIYAGTWWRAYKTTDGGNNWRLVKDGMIDDSDVFAIDINPENPDHVIASACSGIYESTNGGEKWRKIQGIPSQSRRTRDIVQHPAKTGVIFAGTTEGLWMSTNGGRSWRMTTTKDTIVNSIAVHPEAPDRIFLGTDNNGVMVSLDGGRTFQQSNGNFSSRFTYNLTPDVEQKNRLYAVTINTAGGGGNVFISDDFGQTWSSSVKGIDTGRTIPYSIVQDRTDPQILYLASNFGIYRSPDRGASWKLIEAPKPVRKTRARRGAKQPPKPEPGTVPALETKINILTYTEDGKDGLYAGTNNGLYVTYDVSKGWKKLEFGEGIGEQVFAVHVNPKMPQIIWAGTANSGVLMSNDSGATWTKMDGVPDKYPISTITSDPTKPERLYVGLIHTIYLSRDFGKTWVKRGGNLPLGNYTSILIDPDNTDEVYAASA
ncbi:MAG: hypothetical protein J5I65_16450, partial [Aridibacter famidurans]|nr:hypothetical protein [Aridibacter famidurans]